ncbi:MAG: hypothetical protein V1720_19210 [bacterium]
MQISFEDIIGTTGVAIVIIVYFILQMRKMKSESLLYSMLNLVGSLMIIYSLTVNFNLSAFIQELFWVIISFVGIVNFFRFSKKGTVIPGPNN